MNIYFDIETGPRPKAELLADLPPFDPECVKIGNIKDPAKISDKIAEAKLRHESDYVDKAALDALTGQVVAIGYKGEESSVQFLLGDEAQMLADFWRATSDSRGVPHRVIGFNSSKFDLPFLIRRSWKHRIKIPRQIRSGRYWSDYMVDLRDIWSLGEYQCRGSLDAVARHLGVGAKNGEGANFAQLLQVDKERALDYLRNDVELVERIADIVL